MHARFNISVARFFICSYLFFFHGNFPSVNYDPSLYQAIGLFHLLPGPITEFWFLPLHYLWLTSLLAAALGLFVPLTMGIAVLSGTYVMAYANNFGTQIMGTALAYLSLWLIFLSEFGHQKKNFLKLMQVVIVMFYCVAGLQKLRLGGWNWIGSENLALQVYANRMTPLAKWLLSIDSMWLRMLAGSVVAIEILSPLALIGKRTALVFVMLWISMHVGIQLVFDYHRSFLSAIPCLALFIDWGSIAPIKAAQEKAKFFFSDWA